jgi:hypothetical protein
MSYFAEREKRETAALHNLALKAEFPKNALIELTNGCNHACVFCKNSNQHRRVSHLSLEKFENFVAQAARLGLEEIGLYATGEPFMVRELPRYIKLAKSKGIRRVYITTNGALATLDKVIACHEAGLDSIKFSINASNREEYKLVHGSDDFDKVVEVVRDISNWRTRDRIDLQMLGSCVMIPAIGDIKKSHFSIFSRYFEDIVYVDAGSQGGQAFQLVNELETPIHGIFSDLEKEVPATAVNPCGMLWNRYHLTAEGYLTSCCVDYELDLVFGDLESEGLEHAWNNELIRKLRAAHIGGDLTNLLCDQCMHNKAAPYEPVSKVARLVKPAALLARHREKLRTRIQEIDASRRKPPRDNRPGRKDALPRPIHVAKPE